MKRFLLCLLALGLCGVAAASADDNVRDAQSRLKDGGFYFGEVNGTFSSETAAAVTRYQIRNGLQISGQLDAATAKSLGVSAVVKTSEPAPATDSDTWRRLRKTDQRFLSDLNKRKPVPAAQKRSVPVAPAAAEPTAQTFTLSQERLRDYVGAFVLAGLNPGIGSELEFFADRVSYFDEGIVGRSKIQRDLQSYNQRWPDRRFWLAGPVKVAPRPDSRISVIFPLRFELRNGAKRSSGKVEKTLIVEVAGDDDLQIVAVNERHAR